MEDLREALKFVTDLAKVAEQPNITEIADRAYTDTHPFNPATVVFVPCALYRKSSDVGSHNFPDTVCDVGALFALFGTTKHANGNGRLLIDRETRRLHDFDMDYADLIVRLRLKLRAVTKLDDLLKGRFLGVLTALRRRMGTGAPRLRRRMGANAASNYRPIVLAGGVDHGDDCEICLEKRVKIVKPFHLAHPVANVLQFVNFVLIEGYALYLDMLAFQRERLARRPWRAEDQVEVAFTSPVERRHYLGVIDGGGRQAQLFEDNLAKARIEHEPTDDELLIEFHDARRAVLVGVRGSLEKRGNGLARRDVDSVDGALPVFVTLGHSCNINPNWPSPHPGSESVKSMPIW